MKKQSLVFAALALAAAPALGQTYDNGGMDPQAGGCSGGQYSAIEAPNTVYGNNTIVTSFHQADDFTVPGGQTWTPTDLKWYLYQTSSPTNEPIVAVYIRLWRGSQADMLAGAGVLVGGDMTTNRLSGSSVFTNIYRTTAAAPTDCNRAIKEVTVDMSWAGPLAAGQYWIEIGSEGNPGYSGPWANHVVPRDGNENSIYFDVALNTWTINGVGYPVNWDYPFKLNYTGGGGCPSDFTATKSGTCPTASKITWTGAPANSTVRVIYTSNNGNGGTIPPGNACAGKQVCIGLAGITLHSQSLRSNAQGGGSTPNFAAPCGLKIQLITQGSCKTSNKVTL